MTRYRWLCFDDEWRPAHVYIEGATRSLCNRAERPAYERPWLGVTAYCTRKCTPCVTALENAIDFAEVAA